MFFENPKQNNKNDERKEDIPLPAALGILGVIGCMLCSTDQMQAKFQKFYYDNYEYIYLGGFLVVAIFVGIIWHLITSKTKKLKGRVHKLKNLD